MQSLYKFVKTFQRIDSVCIIDIFSHENIHCISFDWQYKHALSFKWKKSLHNHFSKLDFMRLLRISRSDDQFLINQYISHIGWICRNPLPGSSFTDNLCARLSWKIFICPKTLENFFKNYSLLNPFAGDLCVQLLRRIVRQRRCCLADFFPNLGFLNKSFLGN